MGPHRKTQQKVLAQVGDDLLFAEMKTRLRAKLNQLYEQRDVLQGKLVIANYELEMIRAEEARLLNEVYPPDYAI